MEKWEYKEVNIQMSDIKTLNDLGQQGWEMVSFIEAPLHAHILVIFKRKII